MKTTLLEYQGETKSLTQWATQLNLTVEALKYRLRTWGTDNEKTFQKRGLVFNDETKTLAAWGRELGVAPDTLHRRIKRGLPMEKVLTPAMFKTRTSLVGIRFNRLVVLEDSGTRQCGKIIWRCLCDCGNTKLVQTGNLIQKRVQSCGCLKKYAAFIRSHPHLSPYFELFLPSYQ
jgi:hypothetical protein